MVTEPNAVKLLSSLAGVCDRTLDPAAVRGEVEAAGFRYAGATEVRANPADDHTLKVFDPSLRGRTDQFGYKSGKPK